MVHTLYSQNEICCRYLKSTLFAAKEAFETAAETADLAASVVPEQVVSLKELLLLSMTWDWRVNICAGSRPALLKHATCTLSSWAGSNDMNLFVLWFLTFYSVTTTTLQHWGAKVRAVHIAGAYWAPGFANYLILLQVFYQPISKEWKSKCRRQTSSLTTWPTARARRTLQLHLPCLTPLSGLPNIWYFGRLTNFNVDNLQKQLEKPWWQATCHFRLVERAADENPTLQEVTENLWREQQCFVCNWAEALRRKPQNICVLYLCWLMPAPVLSMGRSQLSFCIWDILVFSESSTCVLIYDVEMLFEVSEE